MTANIMNSTKFIEQGAGRKRAWHNLGQTFNGELSAVEALHRIGGLFEVHKMPLLARVGEDLRDVTGKVALYREPVDGGDWKFFGVVSNQYEPVQNSDIAGFLDSTGMPLETMGILGDGETTFATLKFNGNVDIGGDEVEEYFLVSNKSDGTGAMKIAYTPVRVVCQNTLVSGLRAATISHSLTHRNGIHDNAKALHDIASARQFGIDAMRRLVTIKVAKNRWGDPVEKVAKQLYPDPKQSARMKVAATAGGSVSEEFDALLANSKYRYESQAALVVERRQLLRELFGKFNDEQPQSANTGWALYNAAVESADFRRGMGKDNHWASALFGYRADEKAKAFELVSALKQE